MRDLILSVLRSHTRRPAAEQDVFFPNCRCTCGAVYVGGHGAEHLADVITAALTEEAA